MKVFISYRREDSGGHAGRLSDRLAQEFGAENVFFDLYAIAPGESYPDRIRKAIGASDVLLAVIGRRWAATGEGGARQLDDPDDDVRVEIASALREGVRVIPVLVQGAAMPGDGELPAEIKDLSKRNAIELSDARWNHDTQLLVNALRGRRTSPPVVNKWRPIVAAAAAFVLVSVLGFYVATKIFWTELPDFDACFREQFPNVGNERQARLRVGAKDFVVVESVTMHDGSIFIRLLDSGRDLGAVAFGYVPGPPQPKAEPTFNVLKVLDSDCREVADYDNESIPGAKRTIQNWNTLRLPLGGKTYQLRVGYHAKTDTVMANFSEAQTDSPPASPPAR